MKHHLRYGWYVLRHKWFVLQAACRLGVPWLGLLHDLSKLLPDEWGPYALSFYGPWPYKQRPAWLVEAFDAAWLRHQHRNKHHWQHWVLREDSGATKVLDMPDRYRRELLADWRGAGKAITGQDNTKSWWLQNGEKMLLHDNVRLWLDGQLRVTLLERAMADYRIR